MDEEATPNGVIVLDKAAGLPSNKVMERLKRMLGLSGRGKAGFLGTLDPLATGVLPVFFGKSTKLISAFEGMKKTYQVTLRLGQSTDTYDAEGEVVAEADPSSLTEEEIRTAILSFQGEMQQVVPRFSAVKIGGVPAYKLARKGEPVPEKVRKVVLAGMEIERIERPDATFRVTCSAGAYMRALANDIGETLGVGAHVTGLRRLACGSLFTLENSITLDRIEESLDRGSRDFLLNPALFLPDYLPVTVEDATERRLRDGQTIPLERELNTDAGRLHPSAKVKALRPCGTLVAIGEVVSMRSNSLGFQPNKVLV